MNKDFIIQNNILMRYCGENEIINIPEGIKEIDSYVFTHNTKIKQIILPKTLNKIKDSAFFNCLNLEKINLENVSVIENYAFGYCDSLSEINLLKINKIYDNSFSSCENLKKVNIQTDGIGQIIECAFFNCKNLTNINILNYMENINIVKIIGINNLKLTEVTGPFIITENGVVYNKDKRTLICYLESKTDEYFKIPDSVIYINESCINNNRYLKTLEFGNNVESIGEYAINSKIENIIFNKKLKYLNNACITNKVELKEIDLRKTKIKHFQQNSIRCKNCKIYLPINIETITSYEKSHENYNRIIINKKSKPQINNSENIEYEPTLKELLNEGKTFREASKIISDQER